MNLLEILLVVWHKCSLQLAAIQGQVSVLPIGGKGCFRFSGAQLPTYSYPGNVIHF